MTRQNLDEVLKVVASLNNSAITTATTTNGTGVDCQGYREALVVLAAGTFTGSSPSVTVSVQESSDDGSSDAYAAVTGAAFTAVTTANDATLYVGRVKCEGTERYLRASAVSSGTITTIDITVVFVLGSGLYLPSTQVQTVAFSV